MATVLVTGGTGLVGSALCKALLDRGYRVHVLSRTPSASAADGIRYFAWDPSAGTMDENALHHVEHIIHLAGAGVADQRWTARQKKIIASSRVDGASLLVQALNKYPNQVKSVVSASAIGWYGPDNSQSRKYGFTEDAPAHHDFLGETCSMWETALAPAATLGERVVWLRTGIVLSEDGGALEEFARPMRFGIATILGSGEQIISWIHIDDLCRMYIFAIENAAISGIYNAVAPQPVSNKELILTLARKKRGKFFIPVHVPSFVLKIALGEMSIEVLKSATVSSGKIKKAGFVFQYPTLNAALHLK